MKTIINYRNGVLVVVEGKQYKFNVVVVVEGKVNDCFSCQEELV